MYVLLSYFVMRFRAGDVGLSLPATELVLPDAIDLRSLLVFPSPAAALQSSAGPHRPSKPSACVVEHD